MVDQNQLENTLVNLAINARDAMPDGGKLTVKCENLTIDREVVPEFEKLPAGDYVRLSFTDTGTDMPDERTYARYREDRHHRRYNEPPVGAAVRFYFEFQKGRVDNNKDTERQI